MRCVLGFLAICILAGCSTSADQVADSDDQEVVGATKVIEAQLRTDPRAVVDASCDRYTALSLSKTRDGKLYLELENKLAGTCEIAIVPDKRSYGVVQSSDGCGSTLYKGTRGADSVTLRIIGRASARIFALRRWS